MGEDKGCGCSCSCCEGGDAAERLIFVEYLYLDLDECGRCSETYIALGEALKEAGPVLEASGVKISLTSTKVESKEQAIGLRFQASPTIRMNGRDICETVDETCCQDCSNLCGNDVTCRVWNFRGRTFSSAPKALIVDALLKAAYSPAPCDSSDEKFTLPENLRRFFEGRR